MLVLLLGFNFGRYGVCRERQLIRGNELYKKYSNNNYNYYGEVWPKHWDLKLFGFSTYRNTICEHEFLHLSHCLEYVIQNAHLADWIERYQWNVSRHLFLHHQIKAETISLHVCRFFVWDIVNYELQVYRRYVQINDVCFYFSWKYMDTIDNHIFENVDA